MKTISHGHFGPNTVPGESTSESVKEAHEHTNVSYDPYQHNAVEQANEHMQANAPKHMQGSYHADQDYADLGDDNRVYDTRHACSTAAEALTQLHLHTHAHSDLDHHDHIADKNIKIKRCTCYDPKGAKTYTKSYPQGNSYP